MAETGNKEKDMMMGHHSVEAEKSFKRRKVFLCYTQPIYMRVCVMSTQSFLLVVSRTKT